MQVKPAVLVTARRYLICAASHDCAFSGFEFFDRRYIVGTQILGEVIQWRDVLADERTDVASDLTRWIVKPAPCPLRARSGHVPL
jgi:hypothetical protein